MKLHIAHLHAQNVASSTYAAHWCETPHTHKHLVKASQDSLVQVLAGEPAGTPAVDCRASLIDLIGAAIDNSTDVDATPESQAEAILEDILNNCLPMPAEVTS